MELMYAKYHMGYLFRYAYLVTLTHVYVTGEADMNKLPSFCHTFSGSIR